MPHHHILGQTASYYHSSKVDGIDAQGRLKVERADVKIFLFECHHRKDHRSLTNHRSEPLRLFLLANPKFQMNGTFGNVYEHGERARAYATLEFPGTHYLAYRDSSALIRRYDHGSRALDFGCGTVRSTDSRSLGLNVIRADSSHAMLDQARALEPSGEYHRVRDNITGEFASGSFYIILAAVTFDNMPTEAKAEALSGLRTLFSSRSMPAPGCLFNRNLCQRMGIL